jgi:competence protein ComEC
MAAKRRKKRSAAGVVLLLILFLLGGGGGYLWSQYGGGEHESHTESDAPDVVVDGELSIHFLELGNAYTGDCTYIKAGDTDILIDAGSRVSSISTIIAYLDQYVTDNTLEYVIVTHAHQDHYAGFATGENTQSLFDYYDCETVVDFAMTNQKPDAAMYSNYQRELADEIAAGATHLTAAECIQQDKSRFALDEGVTLEILDSYYYYNKSSTENNYSVCCLLTQGDRNYLFTGDLEEDGEEKLVEMNRLPRVEVYKAGHHGSKTSSSQVLLEVIQPAVVCICTCCGSPEYTDTPANQFPTQAFIDRIAVYTDRVYATTLCVDYDASPKQFTSMNGNIVVTANAEGVTVGCSASDLPLKDTEWFKQNRTCPEAWK